MAEPSVVHNTFVVERSFPRPAERVFQALSDPAQKRRWYVAERDAAEFAMDFREGGSEHLRYKLGPHTPLPGVEIVNTGAFISIVPNERVVFTQDMTLGGRKVSAALITFEILPSDDGCEVICTHQGAFFEGSDAPAMREHGWRTLLERLEGALAS